MVINWLSAWRTSKPISRGRKHIIRSRRRALLAPNQHRGGKGFPAICHARM